MDCNPTRSALRDDTPLPVVARYVWILFGLYPRLAPSIKNQTKLRF